MIFLPRDLVQPNAAQKIHDVLASVVLGLAVVCEAHEDDRHAGEEAHEGAAGLRRLDGVARDFGGDVDDGEGHALLNDDGSLDGHDVRSFLRFAHCSKATHTLQIKLKRTIKTRLHKRREARIICDKGYESQNGEFIAMPYDIDGKFKSSSSECIQLWKEFCFLRRMW